MRRAAAVAVAIAGCWRTPAPAPANGPSEPAPRDAVDDVAQVVTGSFIDAHAGCVVKHDGTVACWGGPNLLHYFDRGRTQPVPGPTRLALHDVARMDGTCAVLRDRSLVCLAGDELQPAGIGDVLQAAVSSDHGCALLADHTVKCAGKNGNGDLGVQPYDYNVHRWASVPGATDIVALASGNGVCGVRRDGDLYCWGPHPFREGPDFAPKRIDGTHGIRRVLLGAATCLVGEHDVRCMHFEEGHPHPWQRLDLDAADIVDAAAGGYEACFVLKSGAVTCWGPDPGPYVEKSDVLERRKKRGFARAHAIAGIGDAVQVSVSSTHACVATRTGHARCWGDNEYGQLGDGTLAKRDAPVFVKTYLPELMPGPGEALFGCKAMPDVQRACGKLGKACSLEPPPGYWATGTPRGGALCDERCMQQWLDELRKLPMPACMCTCSPAYREQQVRPPDGPPPP